VYFEAYARALLCQQYPHYEVLFVVESATDPAWLVLNQLLAATPGARAALLVAGPAEGCSQKIHNLLVALAHVTPETRVLSFVDSDVQVHPQWLRHLVTPLDDAAIGATSGYRWYVPWRGNVAGSLRSAWNAALLNLLRHPRLGFAWGGASAIRREVFEQQRIAESWSQGLSDDLLLTQAVRAAGRRIHFVADGLVPTHEPCSWRQLLEWTNRQVTIGRVYAPHAWGASLLIHVVSLTLAALGCAAVATGHWLASGLLLSYWVISGSGSVAVCRAALRRLNAHGCNMAQRAWVQALWAPVVSALVMANIIVSLTTRTIAWRGISYTMLAPQHVVVHREPHMPAPSTTS